MLKLIFEFILLISTRKMIITQSKWPHILFISWCLLYRINFLLYRIQTKYKVLIITLLSARLPHHFLILLGLLPCFFLQFHGPFSDLFCSYFLLTHFGYKWLAFPLDYFLNNYRLGTGSHGQISGGFIFNFFVCTQVKTLLFGVEGIFIVFASIFIIFLNF